MPRFIKLTKESGEPIYINPAQICTLESRSSEGNSFTQIILVSGFATVTETPDEILSKFDEVPA